MEKKLLEQSPKINCKKIIQKKFRIEKVIKRKGDKLYDKWEGYNNSFNSWKNNKALRYFHFKPSFKLRRCRAQYLFRSSQIPYCLVG